MIADVRWVVCESLGRWAAALRLALGRHAALVPSCLPGRIYEVRNLTEVDTVIRENSAVLSLVEVGNDNLADSLEWMSHGRQRNFPFVGMLDESLRYPSIGVRRSRTQSRNAIDVMLEAGALTVLDSTRQVSRIIALSERVERSYLRRELANAETNSLTELWAALPWQTT